MIASIIKIENASPNCRVAVSHAGGASRKKVIFFSPGEIFLLLFLFFFCVQVECVQKMSEISINVSRCAVVLLKIYCKCGNGGGGGQQRRFFTCKTFECVWTIFHLKDQR